MEGFYTYTALSKSEADAHRRNALRGLAMAEKHHADLWAERIKELGGTEPQFSGSLNGQTNSLANRVGGPDLALRRLEIDEVRDIAKYGKQIKELGDEPSIAILEDVIADEREHYLTLSNLIRARGALPALPPEQAQAVLDELVSTREKGHLFGSVTSGDIAHQLEQKGFTIDRRKISLEEPLKTIIGEYHVPAPALPAFPVPADRAAPAESDPGHAIYTMSSICSAIG